MCLAASAKYVALACSCDANVKYSIPSNINMPSNAITINNVLPRRPRSARDFRARRESPDPAALEFDQAQNPSAPRVARREVRAVRRRTISDKPS